MIKLQSISKKYKTETGINYVLRDLNIFITLRDKIALLGKNGVGKSTFIKILGGIESPDTEKIITDNTISWPIGAKDVFHPLLTVKENVVFISKLHFGNNEKEINEKLKFVRDFDDIGNSFNKPFKTISKEMKMRVSFGVSMAFKFDFYCIDELSTAGDHSFRKKTKSFLDEHIFKSSFIIVDNNLDNLKKICNKAFILHNAKIDIYDNVTKAIDIHKAITLRKNKNMRFLNLIKS